MESAVDRATFYAPARQQWRMQSQEHEAVRLPQRNTIAVPGEWPETPILTLVQAGVAGSRRDGLLRLPAAVFVPPRV
jgi:hypothetical protein